MLKIEYHDREGTKEIYMAIREDGISDLMATLVRAEEKAATLEKLLDRMRFPDAE